MSQTWKAIEENLDHDKDGDIDVFDVGNFLWSVAFGALMTIMMIVLAVIFR
jgi:hypothetical protein